MTLNFEIDYLKEKLKEKEPKKVLVQLPEGIKQNVFEISKIFEELRIEVIFSGETCWGGCSIAVQEAQIFNVDLIVHFGHARFIDTPKNSPEILYIEVRDELDLIPMLKKSLDKLKDFKEIGLSYSIQHRHDLEKIKDFYEKKGKKIILSKKLGKVDYEGHVVGCQYSGLKAIQDNVEVFVIIGNNFHSMGAALSVEKPVILIDVYNNDVLSMEGVREKMIKERAISIENFKKAKKIGVITEIKPGQQFGSANAIIKKLKDSGKDVILISMNEMTPNKLMNFYSAEAFVELACPRITIDDFAKYERTIVTFKEALVALGELSWEDSLKTGLL